jgi:ABC-type Mn2+/Zn2+ transport system permease subunit
MFKDFLFVSFDPVVATVAGFPIGWANAILFVLIAVVISVCTRAVGAMPVFALTILPPTAALQIHDRIVPAAITSALLGGFCAGAGYFATGIWELPVGPCIVLAAAIPAFVAWSIRRLLHWNVIRGERRQTIQS